MLLWCVQPNAIASCCKTDGEGAFLEALAARFGEDAVAPALGFALAFLAEDERDHAVRRAVADAARKEQEHEREEETGERMGGEEEQHAQDRRYHHHEREERHARAADLVREPAAKRAHQRADDRTKGRHPRRGELGELVAYEYGEAGGVSD